MCNACECSTSGLNPRQIWREMSNVCDYMLHKGYEAGTDIRFCTKEIPHQFCEIDRCPRLKIELPEDVFDIHSHYAMVEGKYTTIYRDTQKAAQDKATEYIQEKRDANQHFVPSGHGWIQYKEYLVYFVRLRNATEKD